MHRLDRPRQILAVALSALAGFVDASGFVANGGYFVSFMSGNSTRLAVDLAGDWGLALVPAGLILGFVGGVALGTLAAAWGGARRKQAVLALVTGLLLLSALARMAGLLWATQGALVVAMGALNATFLRQGEVAVGLTYITGALVRVGQALAAHLQGQRHAGALAATALWLGLVLGGVLGAFLAVKAPEIALWLAAGWAAAMGLIARRLPV